MPHARITVPVDAQLHWVVRVPEALAGTTRACSPAQLASHLAEFEAMRFAPNERPGAALMVGAITRAVIELLSEPPQLPFIGDPFGGDDATD
jgi:hypothetical protein